MLLDGASRVESGICSTVGARHAVPGERTWHCRAICRDREFKGEHWWRGFGGWRVVLVARSGTACRAPTGKATTRTKNVVAAAPSIGDRRVKY